MPKGLFTLAFMLISTSITFSQSFLKNHKFLITSVRTGDTEIFVVDPYQGDAQNVSKSPHSEDRYPAWSPDGKYFVFTSNRNDSLTYDIYIARADGSQVRRLTRLPAGSVAYWPSWTADGHYIYFNEGNTAMIYRIKPNGKALEKVAEGRDGNISPDGKWIVFTQQGKNGYGVWVMQADGSEKKQIIPQESQIGGIAPVWSPDGKRIAFSGQVNNFAEIFTVHIDGTDLQQVTNLQQISSSPAFSPDGHYITFRVTNEAYWRDAQKRAKTYEEKAGDKRPVWIVKADGSNPQLIEVLHYQCAMDGSRAEWKPK
ncbi:MAG: DUF5050 domain-containing protein [Saprospiraceae bacterium]